ncbi:MAG: DeoR family transcriptional regulator [Methanosarcinales archaeon]|nr:MAG: DeoR family transcriptional regulator [Methanosarcinales archaeon]
MNNLGDAILSIITNGEGQEKSIKHIEKYGKITRAEYEKLYSVSERTANRELNGLVNKKLIEKRGRGPGTHYVLASFGEFWRDKMKMSKGEGHLAVTFVGKLTEEYLRDLGLNERQIKAIEFLKRNKKITNADLKALFLNVSSETARLDLSKLVKLNLIEKKGAYYVLK